MQAASTLEARAVVRKINRLFRGTKEMEALPKEASDYTREQIDAAVETYQAYLQLTEQEQFSVRENCNFSQENGVRFDKLRKTLYNATRT